MQPFGAHEGEVGDADEPKDNLQIRLGMLKRRVLRIHPAARDGDDHALAMHQAFRTGRAVPEGLAGDDHAIDPGLQLRRDAEVVHRRANDDDIGRQEIGQDLRIARLRLPASGPDGARSGAAAHWPPDPDARSADPGTARFQRATISRLTVPAGGVVTEDARVDMQQLHGVSLTGLTMT